MGIMARLFERCEVPQGDYIVVNTRPPEKHQCRVPPVKKEHGEGTQWACRTCGSVWELRFNQMVQLFTWVDTGMHALRI